MASSKKTTRERLQSPPGVEIGKVWSIAELLAAVERRMNDFSQREIARQLSMPDYEVRHLVRLIRKLHPRARKKLEEQKLSFGHARALIQLSKRDQEKVMGDIFQYGLSVMRTRQKVKALKEGGPEPSVQDSGEYEKFAEKLAERVGHPLKIKPAGAGKSGGTITLRYADLDDLDALIANVFKIPPDSLYD